MLPPLPGAATLRLDYSTMPPSPPPPPRAPRSCDWDAGAVLRLNGAHALHGHNVQATYRMMVTLFSFFSTTPCHLIQFYSHMALPFGLHCYQRNDHCVHRGPCLRLSPATSPEKLSNFTHMALGFGLHCYERNDHCVHCGPYLRLSPATCPEKLAAVPHPVVPIATFFPKS
jgi:hypothetical protein